MKNCRKCNIELTEEIKVKRENLCKPCKKIIDSENKKKKLGNEPVISNDEPITITYIKNANDETLKCRVCTTLLTNINKVQKNNFCILCSVPITCTPFSLIEYINRTNFKTNLFLNRISNIKIKLTDDNKGEILDEIFGNVGYYIEQINNEIEDKILNYE